MTTTADRPLTSRATLSWIAGFAVLVLATQLGALRYEVIDWDESTFLVMANEVRLGHLPYVRAFDIKPPGLFVLLAGVELVFGKSLWAARLFGDAAILAIAIGVFATARRFASRTHAGLASAAMIALLVAPFGQHTSTELPATAFMMIALAVALRARAGLAGPAIVGLLMAGAVLTRLNLAAAAVVLGGWYALKLLDRDAGAARWSLLAYGAAGAAPFALLVGVYAAADELAVLRVAFIDAPAGYATQQIPVLRALGTHIAQIWTHMDRYPAMFIPFTAASLIGGAGLVVWLAGAAARLARGPDRRLAGEDGDLMLVLALWAGVLVSVLAGGAAFPHYWIQLVPLVATLAAAGAQRLDPRALRTAFSVFCALAIAGGVIRSAGRTAHVLADPAGVVEAYPIRRVSAQIDADRAPGDTVWALEHQLALWYLDVPPATPLATHPSNVAAPFMAAPLARIGKAPADVYRALLDSRPRYLVMRDAPAEIVYLSDTQRAEVAAVLADDYERWLAEEGVTVYRRR